MGACQVACQKAEKQSNEIIADERGSLQVRQESVNSQESDILKSIDSQSLSDHSNSVNCSGKQLKYSPSISSCCIPDDPLLLSEGANNVLVNNSKGNHPDPRTRSPKLHNIGKGQNYFNNKPLEVPNQDNSNRRRIISTENDENSPIGGLLTTKKRQKQVSCTSLKSKTSVSYKETGVSQKTMLNLNKQFGSKQTLVGRGCSTEDNAQIDKSLKFTEKTLLAPVYLDNGTVYEGEWLKGMREGEGKQTWADRSVYTGEWKANQACGKGKLLYADGDIYEGQWKNDKSEGFGTFTHTNEDKYEGYWKEDLHHGKGKETWAFGETYEGDYQYGVKEGFGRLQYLDGSYYEGQFLGNELSGQGKYVWGDRQYEGEWEHNQMHGSGKMTWLEGNAFEGKYVHDKRCGYGVFEWADGRKHIGGWKNGKQDGVGEAIDASGGKRKGFWEQGKILKWRDGGNKSVSSSKGSKGSTKKR